MLLLLNRLDLCGGQVPGLLLLRSMKNAVTVAFYLGALFVSRLSASNRYSLSTDMASLAFAAGLDIQHPPSAKTNTKPPSVEELDAIELPNYGLVSSRTYSATITPAGSNTPYEAPNGTQKTPNELEHSQPPTPKQGDAALIVPSWSYPRMNKWRVLATCMEYFGNGLNDSAPGALLPYIETWYGIGYAVVSTIWISNAVGFILAAFLSDFICSRLGRAKTLMLSEISVIAGYIAIACPVPFPVVVVAYMFVGFGEALGIALNNVFCANLVNSTVILGGAHGSYGIGGILGPIIATALVSNGVHWSRFFAIAIAIRVFNLAAVGWSFWNYEKEGTTQFNNSLEQIASRQAAAELGEPSKRRLLGRALNNRVTIIGALFIFAYQGAEVSESGWFISFLISERHGNPARVGYVTSGFWAGITVGRFVLTHIAHRVGEKRFVFALTVGTIGFQLLAWFVPNIIGDAVSVAIVGLLLGPVYPCAATVFTRLLPANIQIFAIGFISSAGSSGGAVVPFITGLVSSISRPHCQQLSLTPAGCTKRRYICVASYLYWFLRAHDRMLGRPPKDIEEERVIWVWSDLGVGVENSWAKSQMW